MNGQTLDQLMHGVELSKQRIASPEHCFGKAHQQRIVAGRLFDSLPELSPPDSM